MKNIECQEMSVNELVTALYEELELEIPRISKGRKLALVEFMAWDIFHRGEYKPLFDAPKTNFTKSEWYNNPSTIKSIISEGKPKNKEIIVN